MCDYYVIRRLADSPSHARALADGPQALGRGAVQAEEIAARERDDSTAAGMEFFADDVVVDFPSVRNAVARILVSVGMWEFDGIWPSEVSFDSTDAVE